jgi:hypothetical protein
MKKTKQIIDVCLAGAPAINGNCGDPTCVCCSVQQAATTLEAHAKCVDTDELRKELEKLSPADRAAVAALISYTDVTSNGVKWDAKAGGPWDSETIIVLHREAHTEEQIEAAKAELESHLDVYKFEVA